MNSNDKIYFITVDPEDKSPGVLCRIMNRINYYITSNGGSIVLDSYNPDFTFGKMAFRLGKMQNHEEVLCYIHSLAGVTFI